MFMRVSQHNSIYQITFLPSFFPVNCYLVEEEEELTLVDAALPYSYKGILETARKIGKPITRIVLTHAHDDHLGALDHLKEVLPDAKVMISARDAKMMNGDRTLEEFEPQVPIRGGVSKSLKTKPDELIQDGDRIGFLQAVIAPGHTPGMMAFFDTRDHSIIAGDAYQTRGGIAVAGKLQPFFPFPAFGTWSKELSIESAKKLASLQPTMLAVGHGKMIVQPVHAMNKAIKKAEESRTKHEARA
jgi:glyoxylase-like metal-dependent hydrolase (beta-lactamase superfamily II)